ncbi:MAG TPA: methylenetetrahydrofolate reductase [NAD(P)H] [Euzebyales bacterium]|nr:methylenetetrahydrofolate reductase [NAD(P)H] [Euzebyales bacterium]
MPASIVSLLRADAPTLSFEFFPPKTDQGRRTLWRTIEGLADLAPDFVSVTYGAGGSTRDRTLDVIERVRDRTALLPVMHLTCVGATREELTELAHELTDRGVTDVLALRGDPPDGPAGTWVPTDGGFRYAAELVALLDGLGGFEIGVAAFPEGHPASPSRESDIAHLAAKCAVGAGYAITQFFFDVKQYVALVDDLRAIGCETPIVPGVLPVTNPAQTRRFAAAAGATIPADLDAAFRAVEDDPATVHALGVGRAIELSRDLLAAGAPGLHIYTLNRAAATREICEALRGVGALPA